MNNDNVSYYGMNGIDSKSHLCYEYNSTDFLFYGQELFELEKMAKEHTTVLYISIMASTIIERTKEPHVLLKHRFGLSCDSIFERQIKTFEGVVRVLAVNVHNNQLSLLLKILFDLPNRSFVVFLSNNDSSRVLEELPHYYEMGILTPSAIKKCINSALDSNAAFLHILRGNNGFSINLFQGNR